MTYLRWYTKYKDQQSPLDAVQSNHFPLHIPLAFITSQIDNRVPIENTQRLINILKDKHLHLHHLMLENSHHSLMHCHDNKDVNQYLTFVNDLYETYL